MRNGYYVNIITLVNFIHDRLTSYITAVRGNTDLMSILEYLDSDLINFKVGSLHHQVSKKQNRAFSWNSKLTEAQDHNSVFSFVMLFTHKMWLVFPRLYDTGYSALSQTLPSNASTYVLARVAATIQAMLVGSFG